MSECVVLEPDAIVSEIISSELEVVEIDTSSLEVIEFGVQGPPGPQGGAVALVAAGTLSGHRVLAANGDGQAIYAQHTDDTALIVQGISPQAGVAGDALPVLRSGLLAWPAGGLTAGAPLFLTTDGQLSHTPPATGWIRQIAVAVDSDTISIDIAPAWRVGD
jgi:hypothetical protein